MDKLQKGISTVARASSREQPWSAADHSTGTSSEISCSNSMPVMGERRPELSIIVFAYNGEKRLENPLVKPNLLVQANSVHVRASWWPTICDF